MGGALELLPRGFFPRADAAAGTTPSDPKAHIPAPFAHPLKAQASAGPPRRE